MNVVFASQVQACLMSQQQLGFLFQLFQLKQKPQLMLTHEFSCCFQSKYQPEDADFCFTKLR